MIEIPVSSQTELNEQRYGMNDSTACIICNAPITNPRFAVRVYAGSYICMDEEIDDANADSGLYFVGADCVKRFPQVKAYVQPLPITAD